MLSILIWLKKCSNFLFPATLCYGGVLAVAMLFGWLFGANTFIGYTLMVLSLIVLIAGIILLAQKESNVWEISKQRVFLTSSSLSLAGLLIAEKSILDKVLDIKVIITLVVLFLLSLVYRRFFKRLVVTEVLKYKIDTDFDFLPGDNDESGRLIAEHLQNQLKRKYVNSLMVRPLSREVDAKSGALKFTHGFITKGKAPKIVFELEVEFDA